MNKPSTPQLTRRQVLTGLLLTTASLLTKDLLFPASAIAGNEELKNNSYSINKYHIFLNYTAARTGGEVTINLRSGEKLSIKIPDKTIENKEILVPQPGKKSQDITVVCHTLYDREVKIGDQIFQEIESTQFIQGASKTKCKNVYEQVEDGEYIDDLVALELLDYVISTSKLNDPVKQRYQLASTNSCLLGIEKALESTLAKSSLTDSEKKLLRGTYVYVRAEEPVPDFQALTDLDSIISNSQLPIEIKQAYSIASATSRALTINLILVELIDKDKKLTQEQKNNYLALYEQVRDGKKITDEATIKSLDQLIEKAEIPANAKVVYFIARKQNIDDQQQFNDLITQLVDDADQVQDQLGRAKNQGSAIIPQATRLLSLAGAETATGVSISSLSGAAATNATLAFLGGGSVATGGLGMLGGLAVATGGAALIGAAGLLSIALVSEMDHKDLANLGIAVGTGTLAGAATVLAAWTAASALGVAGTLSGAAAITTTISALGGLSIMTEGAALVASGTAFLIWSFLKGGKKREQGILKQLETRIYTLTENPNPDSLSEFIKNKLNHNYDLKETFSAPNIPLDKLSNALSSWVSVNPDEKIIVLVDGSIWNDAKDGAVFTNQRIIWKKISSEIHSIKYQELSRLLHQDLSQLLSNEQSRKALSNLEELAGIIDSEPDKNDWVKKLTEISQIYPQLT